MGTSSSKLHGHKVFVKPYSTADMQYSYSFWYFVLPKNLDWLARTARKTPAALQLDEFIPEARVDGEEFFSYNFGGETVSSFMTFGLLCFLRSKANTIYVLACSVNTCILRMNWSRIVGQRWKSGCVRDVGCICVRRKDFLGLLYSTCGGCSSLN